MLNELNIGLVEKVLQLAPQIYILDLYNYENKFMLYDVSFCQSLIFEKRKRVEKYYNRELNLDKKIDLYLKLKNYFNLDIISEELLNCFCDKTDKTLIDNLIKNFDKYYEKRMEEYISFINNIADYTTLSKEKILPKGIGIFGILSSKNFLWGLERDYRAKERNRRENERKLEEHMRAEIDKEKIKLCNDILKVYSSFCDKVIHLFNINNDEVSE